MEEAGSVEVHDENDSGRFPRSPFIRSSQPRIRTVAIIEEVDYKIEEVDGDILVVKVESKTKPLESSAVKELSEITGAGVWRFNTKLSVPESIQYEHKITAQLGSAQLNIPVKVKYSRLTKEQLAARAEDSRRRFEQLRERTRPKSTSVTPEMIAQWVRDLESQDRKTREAAAEKLASHAKADSVESLVAVLDDPSPVVRASALKALGRLKPIEAAEAIALRLDDDEDRTLAASALRQIGPAVAPVVLKRLDNETVAVREAACLILSDMSLAGEVEGQALRELAVLLDDQAERVLHAAALSLSKLVASASQTTADHQAPPKVVDSIIQLLRKEIASNVPDRQIWGLRMTTTVVPDASELTEDIGKSLKSDSDQVRKEAAAALLALSQGSTEATPQARKPDRDDAPDIVVSAEAKETLGSLLVDSDAASRYWTCRIIAASGSSAKSLVPELIQLRQDADVAVRHAANQAVQDVCREICGIESVVLARAEALADQINAMKSGSQPRADELARDFIANRERIWPVAADRDFALGSRGRQSTTGPNSAEWFGYGGAGNWKTFAVEPNRTLLLRTRGDGQVVADIHFTISEKQDGKWLEKENIKGPSRFSGYRWYFYTPSTDLIRVDAQRLFYIYVYRL